ncbi:hypothetical protein SLEP1_g23130 [Rubroshorea leprosula]|uniref:Uncharacterized protein n=1 Tax=Rubroshorea leprosula TaxID=152421 RepID=A0AAV5JIM9_9ROSI|nr:hypothetical protein SLEP1_g23130 [Rubroshorea leprosula]
MEPPPPEYQTASLSSKDRRFKPIWRILLISNLALGAYIFAKARKKNSSTEEIKGAKTGSESAKVADDVSPVSAVPEAVNVSPVPAVPDVGNVSPRPDVPEVVHVSPVPATIPPIPEETPLPPPPPPVPKPVKEPQPILEYQQRELFKWLLEEKRKVKPKNREEKKRIDEEKAILKQFIRSESIPRI